MTDPTIRRVYMDYQASTPVDPRVAAAMTPFLFEHPGNPHAAEHSFGWEANAAVEGAAARVAAAIGADADEIVFTSGATEANNLAVLGLSARAEKGRRRILVSAVEHTSVLAAARAAAARAGLVVEAVPVDGQGLLRLGTLQELLAEDVLLVSVMSVNNEVGAIQRVAAIARMAHAVGAIVHTDAVQALPATPIDVAEMDVDMLSLSAHKIYGPKGIGALFVRRAIRDKIEPLIYGGGQQDGLRAGTVPVSLCAGFGEAAGLMTGAAASAERVRVSVLRDDLARRIAALGEGIAMNGPAGDARHPGNANLRFGGIDAQELLGMMQPALAVSSGAACTSGTPEPSHVLRAMGLSAPEAGESLRFSVGRFTSEEDVDFAVTVVEDALKRARESSPLPALGRAPHLTAASAKCS